MEETSRFSLLREPARPRSDDPLGEGVEERGVSWVRGTRNGFRSMASTSIPEDSVRIDLKSFDLLSP